MKPIANYSPDARSGMWRGAGPIPIRAADRAIGKLLGLDLAEPMLAKAQENIQSVDIQNVEWLLAPADQIPLPEGSVDVITANGIFNLPPDKQAVMREVTRVLEKWRAGASLPRWC